MRKARLSPSILTCDFMHLEKEIAIVENAHNEWLHLDVMDGHFVPNISFGPPVVKSIRDKTRLYLDTHLMISEPEKYIQSFIKAGSDLLTVHIEVCPDIRSTIKKIHAAGAKAGVSLNPATPVEMLHDAVGYADLFLVMSVNPGFGGQSFMPVSLDKLKWLREKVDLSGYPAILEIDGGINRDNIRQVTDAGADMLVIGSAIFSQSDPEATITEFIRSAGGEGI